MSLAASGFLFVCFLTLKGLCRYFHLGAINKHLFNWNFCLTFISAVIKKGGLFIDSCHYHKLIHTGSLFATHPRQVTASVSGRS